MPRELEINGICLHAIATKCYSHCRYCQLSERRAVPASFDRYEALVNRFLDWRDADFSRSDFGIWPWYGRSYDSNATVREGIVRISRRMGSDHKVVLLGGIRHRSMPEMREWLEAHRKLGIDTLVTTFAGNEEAHDYWNKRRGSYRFFVDSMKLATDMGMKLQQRVFLIRSTLETLDELYDDLDAVSTGDFSRWCIQWFYSGYSKRYENERLTSADFAALPRRIRATLREDHQNWLSEREWRAIVMDASSDEPESMSISFPMNDESMDWAENLSCDEILRELGALWREAYRKAPSRRDLCEKYADPDSEKIYMNIGQAERLWMDRYLAENPCDFDIAHTHFGN